MIPPPNVTTRGSFCSGRTARGVSGEDEAGSGRDQGEVGEWRAEIWRRRGGDGQFGGETMGGAAALVEWSWNLL